MFVLIFTRFTGSDDFVALHGTYETEQEAQDALIEECDRCVRELGFDERFCSIDTKHGQAFCGSFEMTDVVRLHVFDTEHPVGHDNNKMMDFHIAMESVEE